MSPTLEGLGNPLRDLHKRFGEMTDPVRPALWRYCLRLTGSPWDAEDLVQETLTKAFTRLSGFWQPLEPKPYLFRIATNAWIDIQRRSKLHLDQLNEAQGIADPSAASDQGETWAAMETLVGVLPPRQRAVVLLIDVFAFTAGEVAAMAGSTEGAVKATLHRARETLRRTAAEGEAGPTARRTAPPTPLIARYLDAFNRRDPDALAALMTDDVTRDLVGVAEEYGLEYVRKYSMTSWAEDTQPMWAESGELDGRPVLYVFFRTPEHEQALAWILTLETVGERVTFERNFCFCPDLLRHAAQQLGVPTALYGYHYNPH